MALKGALRERTAGDRLAARTVTVRRRPRRWVWAAVAAVVVAALVGWLVWFSPLFTVRHVEVEGARQGQASAVRAAAKVPMGQQLVAVDLPSIVGRVLASGTIETTTVSRAWPSTVVIHVTPRHPVMVLQNPQGQPEVVDRFGVAYTAAGPAGKGVRHLPTVTLEGVTGADTQTALRAAADALRDLPAALQDKVERVSVRGREDVSFEVGTVHVHWGVGGDGPLKARVLGTLLQLRPGHGARPTSVDVSAPDQPVVK
ncbi:MAG TPA: FtsQ-type POTRA domain-containing protein [Segeticoccus sp.]|uniref:cell division protein FtsQ/DivIB n=1 Tax=Segeticoccus sp. TaxID=2706531 RepID=UPI002D80598E|nr:FtsQ-type POTRA domain-containing protein [Segeticoccus sp.]HET8601879.1 FtsQ-type POTRA domain-containing protein [Segeticoccus sp.]